MKIQDRVKLKVDGRIGTICPTIYLLTSDGDDVLSVAFDGQDGCTALNCFEGGRDAFEIIGIENAVPVPEKCGAGKGGNCCIFLTLGPAGFACERNGQSRYDLIYDLIFRTMGAKRQPTEPFPNCMNQGD